MIVETILIGGICFIIGCVVGGFIIYYIWARILFEVAESLDNKGNVIK